MTEKEIKYRSIEIAIAEQMRLIRDLSEGIMEFGIEARDNGDRKALKRAQDLSQKLVKLSNSASKLGEVVRDDIAA